MTRLLAAMTAALVAAAAGAEEAEAPPVRAVHAAGAIRLDGVLDEPDWGRAPPHDRFVQFFPQEGAAPSKRTELRVLYDDHNLYAGVRCYDAEPNLIVRKLGRRDRPPSSDAIQVAIDSGHDHRTAYFFGVNAGGTLFDSLLYDDTTFSDDWDAVWDAAVQVHADGWSAEFLIPLRLLRFTPSAEQTWGLLALRLIAHNNERLASTFYSRSASGKASQFGHLEGLEGLQPRPDIEASPYLAARAVLAPQFSAVSEPRLLSPSLDLGLDLKAALASNLTLNATVNPDFGQVEADELILNLTNFEPFFPEKRPFFTHGMELFESVGGESAPQRLFYSRRIGLGAPILTAAKLTGALGPRLDVGVLDAVVMGASSDTGDEADPDRRLQFHLAQPLHLGPNHALPRRSPPPQNFLVAVVRQKLGEGSAAGGRVALATPLTGTCTEEDAALGAASQPVSCVARGGHAAGVDWDLRSRGSEWVALGQLSASQVVGGPPERTLRDGTVLWRGATGLGAYLAAGKMGGEPFRFNVKYSYSSPTLELNAAGFLPTQNEQVLSASVEYTRPGGLAKLHNFRARLNAEARRTTDGRMLSRGHRANLNIQALLPGFHTVVFEGGYIDAGFDIREVSSTGLPFERPDMFYATVFGQTDENQPLSVSLRGALGWHGWPDMARGRVGWTADVGLIFQPDDRLETRLGAVVDVTPDGPRWVGQAAGQPVFGDLDAATLSLILRQQWVLTPRLTLQAYAQLFSQRGAYRAFYSADLASGGPVRLADLSPVQHAGAPGFHGAALNVNVVLRWEYLLGSTLYLVYTRSQQEWPLTEGQPLPATLLPSGLSRGPATDALLVKWSYLWSG